MDRLQTIAVLLILFFIAGLGFTGQAFASDWTAYNDVVYDSGLNGAGTDPSGQSVHYIGSNVTTFGIGTESAVDTVNGYGGISSGTLIDQATGTSTGVTATLTENGGVIWQPQVASTWTGGYDAASGTDAYNTFNGIADMTGTVYYAAAGWYVDVTFTNLDPAKRYTFVTTASRSKKNTDGTGDGYVDRKSIYTISGVDSAVNASTAGTEEYGSSLSVFFCTGNNYNEGYVARWINIAPGVDGSFTVRAEAHPDSEDSGRKAYAFDVFKLEQYDAGADWTAFNDVVYDSGLLGAGTDPNGQSVHYIGSNVTTFGVGAESAADTINGYGGISSGTLIDQLTGASTGVTATLSESGGVTWQPQVASTWTGGYDCAGSTDATDLFGGIVDLTGSVYYGAAGWYVDVDLTGLDQNKRYTFATTATRSKKNTDGGDGYTDRNTIYSLQGVDVATNESSVGTLEYLGDPLSVTFNTGNNHDEGYIAKWTNISPGADGSFSVRASAHPDSEDGGRKAYSFDGFMLQQYDAQECTEVILVEDDFSNASKWSLPGWQKDPSGSAGWGDGTLRTHSSPKSASADARVLIENHNGKLFTNDLDTSDAQSITIDCWIYKTMLEEDDYKMQFYNGTEYIDIVDFGASVGSNGEWINYTYTTTDPQYFKTNFRVLFWAYMEIGLLEYAYLDDVLITKCTVENSCTVPDVIELTETAACAAIEAEDLNCIVYTVYSDTVLEDIIVDQAPSGGSNVTCNSNVNIFVSAGPPIVPIVIGESEETACEMIENVSLTCSPTYACSSTVAQGDVISQDPAGGQEVTVGSTVNIVVSNGCCVPDVVGLPSTDACNAVTTAGFICSQTSVCSDTVSAGNVISQNPAEGETPGCGTTVSIVVSLGQPLVPAVVGLAEVAACDAIVAAGFTCDVTQVCSDTVAAGYVVDQIPVAGPVACSTTTVYISVSEGKPDCPADLDDDGIVDGDDLLILEGEFGQTGCGSCVADLNGDNDVDGSDLAALAAAFGPCPSCP